MDLDQRLDTSGDFYAQRFQPTKREDTLVLNMGPQHPSTHGVLRILLEIDGEYILRAEPVLGYIHRMHEKIGEVMSYPQYAPYPGRVDYLHPLAWGWAHVGAVERMLDLQVPERAEYIRVITCELNRISSHLLWWGAYINDLGAFTPFFYAFDDREIILDIMQRLTGSRLTYSYFRIGGVVCDIDDRFISDTRDFCKRMRERIKMYHDLVSKNFIVRSRMEEIGDIPLETCRKYGATGPVLRGSGMGYDVRRAEPYSVYDRFDFNIPVHHGRDAMSRYMVRMEEILESIRIIEQALDSLPEGDHVNRKAPKRPKPPAGEVYFAVEGGRGKIGVHLVSDGGRNPYRLKLRSPGFSNLSLFSEVAEGTLIADAISILGSLDLVIPEIDR